MVQLTCDKCLPEDHEGKYFCRCEMRNIEVGKELRRLGIDPWKKPQPKDLHAKDEAHFVDLYLSNQRPFIIWVPDDFDYEKMHKISQERGIVFIKTNFDHEEGVICLENQSSDQAQDSKS